MDWLFNQGIVFDVLPDDYSIEKVINSGNKTQTLACLTYLENEPEQGIISIWQLLMTLFMSPGAFIIAYLFGTVNATVGVVVGAITIAILLIFVFFANNKNYHIRIVAAWANSWSTAIKEFQPAEATEHE